jgi:hypothetical protein
MQDRLAAAAELADRLHGKPIQAIDIDDDCGAARLGKPRHSREGSAPPSKPTVLRP